MALPAGILSLAGTAYGGVGVIGREDQVGSVTVHAGGAVGYTRLKGSTMDGLVVLHLRRLMASPARGGHVEGVDT